ncbi:MarR family winged helix-turn-helix transcriptional regulator [Mycobacterium colombiense]|uniref:MarR family winged helix-turn-helix transcriptional regulator n=1 Tax=Mycobacterium colombiense TaxID=339268 RepID=UPI0007FCC296|nr:MarR family winged helix-turn-helix transcriptional regulator [Mycobacterium colombiense]OBJ79150.1 MarR family transcriptional regulator [Mycobacterium colombiense]
MAEGPWLSAKEQEAWRAFTDMRHTLERHLEWHLQREFGLSDPDFEILVNLSEAPKGRMRTFELAEATQWEKSRMSHHLSRMERRGLIRRKASGARYPDILLTKAGRNAIEASAPGNAARVRKFFIDVLGPDRLRMLRKASDDVLAAIQEHQRVDCPPEIRGS